MKKIIIFDLDNTLAPSKSIISNEMANNLIDLTNQYDIAIISGASFNQFKKQIIPFLYGNLHKIYLFPTCGASFYKYEKDWQNVYLEELSENDKEKIYNAFNECFKHVNFNEKHKYGEILEDRKTQITFSALGQNAPIDLKEEWDPDLKKRQKMVDFLKTKISEFSIRIGGSTSIDVTYKNIDKAYAINKIKQYLNYDIKDCLFIGDSFSENGNDYPIKKIGMDYVEVINPDETLQIIKNLKTSLFAKITT